MLQVFWSLCFAAVPGDHYLHTPCTCRKRLHLFNSGVLIRAMLPRVHQ